MKQFLTVLTALTFLTFNSFSQDKVYIAVSLGSSSPIGDFSSKDPNNNSAGFANSGAIFDISFAYKFNKNFGITALLRGQANITDAQAIADELVKQNPTLSSKVKSGMWSIGGYMLGGYGSFPISEKVSFDSRIMFGFLTATSPEFNVNLSGPGGSAWIKQKSKSSSAFAHLIGVGFKWDAGKVISLLANFDYLGAKPEFRNVETISSLGQSEKNTFSQRFGTINVGVGIGFRF